MTVILVETHYIHIPFISIGGAAYAAKALAMLWHNQYCHHVGNSILLYALKMLGLTYCRAENPHPSCLRDSAYSGKGCVRFTSDATHCTQVCYTSLIKELTLTYKINPMSTLPQIDELKSTRKGLHVHTPTS